ncbi:BTAD domain-containing putative transcriptional regulator [Streptomyces sp. NPDC057644]|uniref:AfsR/SARP family transcriptional regulator n=1 Tax=Streptomyces sp. NPDC057644 TaxID=3346191 RepID=UPI0036B9D72A
MEFRVLGSVEVVDDRGAKLPVSAPMLRALLAALVLRQGQPAAPEELADRLWGPSLPANVRTTLRNYVMRLRRVLSDERIRTEPGGYLLAAESEETDLGRFRALVRRSGELPSEDISEAALLLREALGLWRGVPLADLPDLPLRTTEQPRLEELRLSAAEECYALELALGRHFALVDELSATAREHRLRERLTRLLMLALHRCGRTAEALAVYQEARRELVAELAIEPGSETRALEQAILRDDPRLAVRGQPEPSAPQNTVRPRPSFPPVPSSFVGREVELASLGAQMIVDGTAPSVCLIDGPGGVGKSALAVRAAHEVADRFPDGLYYVDLRGSDPQRAPFTVHDALHLLMTDLGVPAHEQPAGTSQAVERYHAELAERRVLLVLDNALDAAQVAPLLPRRPGNAALVTSRVLLPGMVQAHHFHLDMLSSAEAVALVRTVSGRTADRADRAHWEELVALCGRLPLALRIVATRLASRPRWKAADWVELLRDERGRLAELVTSDLDARASLLLSIDQLAKGDADDQRAAALFPLLGTAAITGFSAETAAALGASTITEARTALERLTDAQITSSPRPGSHRLHDLVRAAAVAQAAELPSESVRAGLERLARWYLGGLHQLDVLLPRLRHGKAKRDPARRLEGRAFETVEAASAWVESSFDDIIALTWQLAGPEYDEASPVLAGFPLEVCRTLENYFTLTLSWRHQERLCEVLLQVAERRGDVWGRAVALSQLGKLAGQQEQGERGVRLLREARAIFAERGDQAEEVSARNNLIPCLVLSGRLEEAVREGWQLYTDLRAAPEPGRSLPSAAANLARCLRMQGRRQEATDLLTEAYDSLHLDYHLAGIVAAVLAECHLEEGAWQKAAYWAEKGLGHLSEFLFDPFHAAGLYTSMSTALRRLGRPDEARTAHARASRLLVELNEREAAAMSVRLRAAKPDSEAAYGASAEVAEAVDLVPEGT